MSIWGTSNSQIVGECSICKGAVTLPIAWWSVDTPKPTCDSCGATERKPSLKAIEMERNDVRSVFRTD